MGKIGVVHLLTMIVVLAGCSSGNGSGKKPGFAASAEIQGRLAPEIQAIRHQPEAERELQAWQNECRGVDGFRIPNLRAGQRFKTREDDIGLWPDLKPTGEAYFLEQTVERITGPKEFYSVQTQVSRNHSITSRSRYTAGIGTHGHEMVSVISTDPPQLKDLIQKGGGSANDNYISCRSNSATDSNWKRDVAFAAFTLENGVTVNGILVVDRMESIDYVCGLYRRDQSLIREERLADRTVKETIAFYSKDTVNPFSAQCHDEASLLEIHVTRDLSGGKGIIGLSQSEVLAF